MSDESPAKKKARYRPPQAPRAVAKSSAPSASHSRSQSMPQVVPGAQNTTSRYRPGSVYPAPVTTTRRASVSTGAHAQGAHPLPAPNFIEVPPADLEEIENPNSDDPDRDADEEGSNDETGIDLLGDEYVGEERDGDGEICEDTGGQFETEEELNAYISNLKAGFAKRQKSTTLARSETPTLPHQSTSSRTHDSKFEPTQPGHTKPIPPRPAHRKSLSLPHKSATPQLNEADSGLVRKHALKCLLSLCGLMRAHNAAALVPLYDNEKNPKWFNESDILIPHFDLSFTDNFDSYGDLKGWGEDFYNALKTGGFATMKEAWARNKDGKGEEKKFRKQAGARHLARKTAKANRRLSQLTDSALDPTNFGFLVDAGYQSSEYSDSDDKQVWVVHEPMHRSKKAQELLGALDVKHQQAAKARSGKKSVITFKYQKVDAPVPKIKAGRIPEWAINMAAIKKKDKLERPSRPNIDRVKTGVPQAELVEQFVYENKPDPRSYINSPDDELALSPIPSDTFAANEEPGCAPVLAPLPPSAPSSTGDIDRRGQKTIAVETELALPDQDVNKNGGRGDATVTVQDKDGNNQIVRLEQFGLGLPGPGLDTNTGGSTVTQTAPPRTTENPPDTGRLTTTKTRQRQW
ncbi:hypothetical protein RhiJN_12928 [Ceratobasidium sp. AG-Ba]|nr:hypothetical protein RhiJN_12928 [Ceratobasidium sp. AG-Ba]